MARDAIRRIAIYAVLITLVALVYARTCSYPFINYDDDRYVTANPHVQAPFTSESLWWAFTKGHFNNWHPLTWLSHMLDYRLFGLNAGAHHGVNVLLHALNAVLVFEIFRRVKWRNENDVAGVGRALFIAALFAVHPLRVESVAWISERKDVLSAFFALLALLAYASYAHRSGSIRYFIVAIFCAFAMMAKSMLVTLPCVFLLFDYWPLRRFGRVPLGRLMLEKVPLFALSMGVGVIAWYLRTPQIHSPASRIPYAIDSYVQYLRMTLWPVRLAIFYPGAGTPPPAWQWVGAAAVLAAISMAAIAVRNRRPEILVGWFWFLGALAPAIGVIQIGVHGIADRYTYFPLLGLFIMITSLPAANKATSYALSAVALGIIALLAAASWIQTGYWRDSETLWRHATLVTANNTTAHLKLGTALEAAGKPDEAETEYRNILRIDPDSAEACNNLGKLRLKEHRFDEAIQFFNQSLANNPAHAAAHINLGIALASQNKMQEAAVHFVAALDLEPSNAEAHYNLGAALLIARQFDPAASHFAQALGENPNDLTAEFGLATALIQSNHLDKAVIHLEHILARNPNHTEARAYLQRIRGNAAP